MQPPNDADDSTGDRPTDPDDPHTTDQPICRVFAGPTSHRVQFVGPESRPATAIDREPNERPSSD